MGLNRTWKWELGQGTSGTVKKQEKFFLCVADQNQNTEHGNVQRVSVLATNPSKTSKPQFVSLVVFYGVKMESAGKNGKKGCTDGLGSRVVWVLPLITFSFLCFQVQVGSTPQDQRIVGYISCTHLQAIAGTVLGFISLFVTISRPLVVFLCTLYRYIWVIVFSLLCFWQSGVVWAAKKGRWVSPTFHIFSLRAIIIGHKQKLSFWNFSLLPLNQILVF